MKLKSNVHLLLWKDIHLQIKTGGSYNSSFHATLNISPIPTTWKSHNNILPTFFNYTEIDPRNFYDFDPEKIILEQQEKQELDKNSVNIPTPETVPTYPPLESMPEKIMDIKSKLQEIRHEAELEPINESTNPTFRS